MVRSLAVLAVLVLTAACAAVVPAAARESSSQPTFFNDAKQPAADPYVLWDPASGLYYAYSTEGADPGFNFAIYRSPDLATWEKVPGGALPAANQWGHDWFWAPEVYHNPATGKYFLFYAARMNTNVAANFGYPNFEEPSKVGVAVADSPAGPFHNIVNAPIDYFPYDPNYHDVNLIMDATQKKPPDTEAEGEKAPLGTYIPFIDPDVFFDPNGNIYLYFSRNAYRNWVWDDDLGKYIEESNIYAVQLDSAWWNDPSGSTMPHIAPQYLNANRGDYTGPRRRDGFTPILDYGSDKQSWENAHVNDYTTSHGAKKDRRWEEGSTTFRRIINGKPVYYLTYSANNYENAYYGVGYATAPTPLGPWKKSPANPILAQNPAIGMYSTGHGSVIESPDGTQEFYVHHGRTATTANRSLYTERMTLSPGGELRIAQSVSDTPLPSGVTPLRMTATPAISTGRVDWQVRSAPGGRFFLGNPQNRVRATAFGPYPAMVTAGQDGATVTLPRGGVTGLRMVYQRERAAGGYADGTTTTTVPVTTCTRTVRGITGPLSVRTGTVCADHARITGPVSVAPGAALVAVDATVTGPLRARDAAAVWLARSTLTGPVTLTGNHWLVAAGNTVTGPMSCAGNGSPTDLGAPNHVAGPVTGQCRGLLQ